MWQMEVAKPGIPYILLVIPGFTENNCVHPGHSEQKEYRELSRNIKCLESSEDIFSNSFGSQKKITRTADSRNKNC